MVSERYDVLQVVSKLQIRRTRIVSLDDVAVMVVIGYLDLQRGISEENASSFWITTQREVGFLLVSSTLHGDGLDNVGVQN